jgi:hypothetical protein
MDRQLNVRVRVDIHAEIKEIANRTLVPINTLVEGFIKVGLDEYKNASTSINTPTITSILDKLDDISKVMEEIKPSKSWILSPKQISYNLAEDKSVVLRSVKGIGLSRLNKLNAEELEEIGLIKMHDKFFCIE